ncbi:hypothetical protein JIN85_17385 [Luteolibacter pohnpeiensis]|uniref:Uncharacterized protein n=1 Tax=Luteolibacter pohnpeiensis TaxID=454153 RepID=A0A934VSE0_9BACT|nr:hypothetical protein [Luteolibacter pohnpeiensis]MBK1884196.1 hypothetical protein [Luteolibacter pohnpeiensis]
MKPGSKVYLGINKRLFAGVMTIAIAAAALVFTRVTQPSKHATPDKEVVIQKTARPRNPHESSQTFTVVKAKGKKNDSKLTPELAKSRLAKFSSKEPNLLKRSEFASHLIQELCQNGFSEEAFQLLDPNHGTMRSNQIEALFTFADLPNDQLIRRIDEISVYKEDKVGALRGYIGRLKLNNLVESVSDPQFQAALSRGPSLSPAILSDNLAVALRSMFAASKVAGAATDPQLLKASKELVNQGYLQPSDFVKVASEGPPGNEFERWEEIQEVIPPGTLISGSTASSLNPGQSLVSRMVMSDGPRALSNLLSVGDYKAVDHAIMQWTYSDPSGATNWYQGNSGQLTPTQNNVVSSAFASTALKSYEFEVARAWAERVQDPKSKEDLLMKISEKEAKELAARAERGKKIMQEKANQ